MQTYADYFPTFEHSLSIEIPHCHATTTHASCQEYKNHASEFRSSRLTRTMSATLQTLKIVACILTFRKNDIITKPEQA